MKKVCNDQFFFRKREKKKDILVEEFGLYMIEKFFYFNVFDRFLLKEIVEVIDIISVLWVECI